MRTELLRHYRRIQRLRLALVGVVVVGLFAAGAIVAGADRLTRDPGFAVLDEVAVPVLDTGSMRERAYGNRWCIGQCRVRERVWDSTAGASTTRDVLGAALEDRGWQPTGDCEADGHMERLCLRRDEFLLDIWITPVAGDTDIDPVGAVVTAVARQMTGPAVGMTGSAVRSTLLVHAS